jgi:molybdopterin converting factor subunit 1
MKVRVILFAIHREKLGQGQVELELPFGATVADLLDGMTNRFPEFVNLKDGLMVAVNTEYVDSQAVLNNDDEVALIPPVSGGNDDRYKDN